MHQFKQGQIIGENFRKIERLKFEKNSEQNMGRNKKKKKERKKERKKKKD